MAKFLFPKASRRKVVLGRPIATLLASSQTVLGVPSQPSDGNVRSDGAQSKIASTSSVHSANIISAPFRPESYGAKLDGISDDTTAWRTLFADIAAKGYGEVLHPGGVSMILGGQLKIPNRCKITGIGRYGSIFRRLPGSPGILLDVSGRSDSDRIFGVILADFSVEGDAGQTGGALMQWMYASESHTENVRVYSASDSGFQIVATWDSLWLNCFVNWCGQGAVRRTSNSDLGQEAVIIAGASAYTGKGASNHGNNNLTFQTLRVEAFRFGLAVSKALCIAGTANSQIRFMGSKWESHHVSGAMLTMSNDARSIWFDCTYVAMNGAIANSGYIDLIELTGNADVRFVTTNIWIGQENAVRSVFYTYPGQGATCSIDGCTVNGPGPHYSAGANGGAIILKAGGNSVPYRSVHYINGCDGLIAAPAYGASWE